MLPTFRVLVILALACPVAIPLVAADPVSDAATLADEVTLAATSFSDEAGGAARRTAEAADARGKVVVQDANRAGLATLGALNQAGLQASAGANVAALEAQQALNHAAVGALGSANEDLLQAVGAFDSAGRTTTGAIDSAALAGAEATNDVAFSALLAADSVALGAVAQANALGFTAADTANGAYFLGKSAANTAGFSTLDAADSVGSAGASIANGLTGPVVLDVLAALGPHLRPCPAGGVSIGGGPCQATDAFQIDVVEGSGPESPPPADAGSTSLDSPELHFMVNPNCDTSNGAKYAVRVAFADARDRPAKGCLPVGSPFAWTTANSGRGALELRVGTDFATLTVFGGTSVAQVSIEYRKQVVVYAIPDHPGTVTITFAVQSNDLLLLPGGGAESFSVAWEATSTVTRLTFSARAPGATGVYLDIGNFNGRVGGMVPAAFSVDGSFAVSNWGGTIDIAARGVSAPFAAGIMRYSTSGGFERAEVVSAPELLDMYVRWETGGDPAWVRGDISTGGEIVDSVKVLVGNMGIVAEKLGGLDSFEYTLSGARHTVDVTPVTQGASVTIAFPPVEFKGYRIDRVIITDLPASWFRAAVDAAPGQITAYGEVFESGTVTGQESFGIHVGDPWRNFWISASDLRFLWVSIEFDYLPSASIVSFFRTSGTLVADIDGLIDVTGTITGLKSFSIFGGGSLRARFDPATAWIDVHVVFLGDGVDASLFVKGSRVRDFSLGITRWEPYLSVSADLLTSGQISLHLADLKSGDLSARNWVTFERPDTRYHLHSELMAAWKGVETSCREREWMNPGSSEHVTCIWFDPVRLAFFRGV